jgi:hypothetical protein
MGLLGHYPVRKNRSVSGLSVLGFIARLSLTQVPGIHSRKRKVALMAAIDTGCQQCERGSALLPLIVQSVGFPVSIFASSTL